MRALRIGVVALLLVGCGAVPGLQSDAGQTADVGEQVLDDASTVRLLFAGDVMLGRRVGPVAASEGPGLLEGIRYVVSSADVAAANLESPLTERPHLSLNPNTLEADPGLVGLLAGAGFDLMAVATNHAGDAGPDGLIDTLAALDEAGLESVGAGPTELEAYEPVVLDLDGARVAFLAFDATGLGPAPGAGTPGVARYVTEEARRAVEAAARTADLVVVSVHGGVEYLLDTDPLLGAVGVDLVEWGADVVWGHGPHVPQPVLSVEDRHAVVATSLGNLLFDQQRAVTQTGLLLEVLAAPDGVLAYRVGRAEHGDMRPAFGGWDRPDGQAALLDGEWWTLVATPSAESAADVVADGFPWGDVTAAGLGDATGDGNLDLVVSYRHPVRETEVNRLFDEVEFADAAGRSAHLGVFEPDGFEPVWGAGTMLEPVAELAVCDGSVALAFDSLDDEQVVAGGAWVWWDFGFVAADRLPGPGTPACADVDRDGALDPVILDR